MSLKEQIENKLCELINSEYSHAGIDLVLKEIEVLTAPLEVVNKGLMKLLNQWEEQEIDLLYPIFLNKKSQRTI